MIDNFACFGVVLILTILIINTTPKRDFMNKSELKKLNYCKFLNVANS